MKKVYVSPLTESVDLSVEAIIATSVPVHNDSYVDDDFMELGNEKDFDWE